jgi:hypothetical protein
MKLTNFLEKNQRHQLQIEVVILKTTSCANLFLKKNKKSKILWVKQKNSLDILPFSSWAVIATWVNLGAPQKLQENELNTRKMK